jgi:hypothetical protein
MVLGFCVVKKKEVGAWLLLLASVGQGLACWWHLIATLRAIGVTSRNVMMTVRALAWVSSTLLLLVHWGWWHRALAK